MNRENTLIVCALPIETQNKLNKFQTLYTGVGKVNAAIRLTRHLEINPTPDLIINYGTAGSSTYNQGQLIDCIRFVQRDMDATGLGFQKSETPFEDSKNDPPLILDCSALAHNPIKKLATCHSGDSFVCGHDANETSGVIDMEAYALAKVCFYYQVPFIAFKYITDGADNAAKRDWEEHLEYGIQEFSNKVLNVLL